MAEITGITPQIKDKERCNIEVDGRFFCGMKLETVVSTASKWASPSRRKSSPACSSRARN